MAGESPKQSREDRELVTMEISANPRIFCKLCLSKHPREAMRELEDCRCTYCTSCLEQYVQLAIMEGGGEPITCPDMTCQKSGLLTESELTGLAAANKVELYRRLKFEREVKLDPSKAWCPVLECQAVCNVEPSTEGQPAAVPCSTCHSVFCSSCRAPWQDDHICPERQPMISPAPSDESSDLDMIIKQCPMCGIYIERNQGCAQMLCKSCKHTFCWYCLQNLDGDIFLRHYDKGPCRNKLGHSRASVMWNRTQVVGILVGVSLIVLATSPLLLLASPCILCCVCKPSCRNKKKKKKRKQDHSQPDSTSL